MNRRLAKLQKAVKEGWIASADGGELVAELQERITQAEQFFPKIDTHSISAKRQSRGLTPAEAWEDFEVSTAHNESPIDSPGLMKKTASNRNGGGGRNSDNLDPKPMFPRAPAAIGTSSHDAPELLGQPCEPPDQSHLVADPPGVPESLSPIRDLRRCRAESGEILCSEPPGSPQHQELIVEVVSGATPEPGMRPKDDQVECLHAGDSKTVAPSPREAPA